MSLDHYRTHLFFGIRETTIHELRHRELSGSGGVNDCPTILLGLPEVSGVSN
jgi:hypothetical protein